MRNQGWHPLSSRPLATLGGGPLLCFFFGGRGGGGAGGRGGGWVRERGCRGCIGGCRLIVIVRGVQGLGMRLAELGC